LFNNLAFVKKGELYGIAHVDNETCLDLSYDHIEYITGLRPELFIVNKSGKWGLTACNSKPLIPLEYSKIEQKGQFLESKVNDAYQLFDFEGRKIDHPDYDSMVLLAPQGPLVYRHKEKWGLMNRKGEEILKNDFLNAKVLSEEYLAFTDKKENLWGIYDGAGLLRIPHIYASCPVIFGDGFFVPQGNNHIWMSKKDKAFISSQIQDYFIIDTQWAWLKINDSWQMARSYGKLDDEKPFDSVRKIEEDLVAKRNNKSFILEAGVLKPYLPFD
jgi:hypothetical protein